jgi:hypothetical protein
MVMSAEIPDQVRVTRVREEHERVMLYKGVEEERKNDRVCYIYYVGLAVNEVIYRPGGKRRIPVWAAASIRKAFPGADIPEHRIRR